MTKAEFAGSRSRSWRIVLWVFGILVVAVALAWGRIKEEGAYILGMEGYVYGYPMVVMDVTREVLTAAPAPNAEGTAAPINQLAKMPHYVSPYFTNVRADQPGLAIDHRPGRSWQGADGPLGSGYKGQLLRLSVMNMWTNVFASIGMRTTGTGPGNFLIAGPDWTGASPADVKQTYRSSTRYAWILGQTQANGPDDFAVVNALQAEYKLTPLSAWGNPYTPPADTPVK